jgi:gas vesicle protein
MKGTDFLVGVVLGSIVGAAVGLLLAPQSGEETREVIGESARDIRDKVKEGSRQVMESSRDLVEQGKGRVSGILQRGRETMEGGQEQAESA